jgi:ABC-type sugar transport system, periplasmic component
LTNDPTIVQALADAGYLLDLGEYAKEYKWDELFNDWALELCSSDGKLIALPEAVEAMVVYYNKEMFAEKGWEVPTTPKEYFDLCEAMKADGLIPNAFGNADWKAANQWWISSGFTAALGSEKFHALLQGELAWESDEVRHATEQLADMWKKGYIYENSAGITLEDSRNLFVTKKAPMMMSGQWDVFELMNDNPEFEWGAFKMPSWNEGIGETAVPVALGGSYAINSKCENPDMAAKFLDFLYNDDYVEQRVVRGTLLPTENCKPSEIEELDSHYVEVYDILLDAMDKGNIGYCSWTYWPPATDTYSWSNLEALYLEQLSMDEYLKNLQEKYDEDVENGKVLKF